MKQHLVKIVRTIIQSETRCVTARDEKHAVERVGKNQNVGSHGGAWEEMKNTKIVYGYPLKDRK